MERVVRTHVEDGGDGVSVRVVDQVDEHQDGEGDPFPGEEALSQVVTHRPVTNSHNITFQKLS